MGTGVFYCKLKIAKCKLQNEQLGIRDWGLEIGDWNISFPGSAWERGKAYTSQEGRHSCLPNLFLRLRPGTDVYGRQECLPS